MRRLLRKRWLFLAGLLVAFVVIGVGLRLACLRGLVRPVQIVSGSMGASLPGLHRHNLCGDCRIAFRTDADASEDEVWVCPNCGYEGTERRISGVRQGQQVLVDRWPLWWREPRRWELWAFEKSDSAGKRQWAVKRVVGLPHERLATRWGDIYVDGQIIRKSLAEQRRLAVLVHDDRYRPRRTGDVPARWQADQAESGWRREARGYVYRPLQTVELAAGASDQGPPQLDWLTYRHWRCFPHPAPRTEETPILDHYGYNQGLSRELYEVSDLLLAGTISWAGAEGEIGLRITDGRERFEVRLDLGGSVLRLDWNGRTRVRRPVELPGVGACHLELSCFDRQILMALEGHLVLRFPYQPSGLPLKPTSRPLAIGAQGAAVRLEGLRIFRDLYYLDPRGTNSSWALATPLQVGEYWVLGDNVPVSDDSRQVLGPVTRNRLAGAVWAPGGWVQ